MLVEHSKNPFRKMSASEPFALVVVFLMMISGFSTWMLFSRAPKGEAALDTPMLITYQGKLTDANRITVPDTALNMKFAIYTSASGASGCVWAAGDDAGDGADTTFSQASDCPSHVPSTAISVTPSEGVVSVVLGASPQNAIPDNLFDDNAALYLGVTVGGDAEMTPRIRLTSTPYAFQAGDADLLDGLDSTAFATTSTAFVQNGNSFSAAGVLGTNDANSLSFETAGVTRATFDTSGNLSVATNVNGTLTGSISNVNAGTSAAARWVAISDSNSLSLSALSSTADAGLSPFGSDVTSLRSAGAAGGLWVSTDDNAPIGFGVGNTTASEERLRITGSATAGTGSVVINEQSFNDVDFRVEGATNANLLVVDGSVDRIGIGTAAPEGQFEIQGGESLVAQLTLDADEGDDVGDTWHVYAWEGPNKLAFYNEGNDIMDVSQAGVLTLTPGIRQLAISPTDAVNPGSIVGNGTHGLLLSVTDAGPIMMRTTDTERMRIDPSGNVGIGDASPDALLDVETTGLSTDVVSITGGTLSGTNGVIRASGTFPTAPGGGTNGYGFNMTLPASPAATNFFNASFDLFSGTNPGTAGFVGVHSVNRAKSSATADKYRIAGGGTPNAATALFGYALGASTTGVNYGLHAQASGSAFANIAVFGNAIDAAGAGDNVGVFGVGLNTGAGKQVGGWFTLEAADPTFVSTALLADNGAQAVPVFLARDNGTAVFTIADGGAVTATSSLAVNGNVTAGDATTDRLTVGGELVLGSIGADPTGVNGMMYYRTDTNKFRCFENSTWTNCIGTGSATVDNFDQVYQESVADGNLTMEIDNASGLTYNLTSTGDFIIQDAGVTFATFDDSGNVAFENGVDLGSSTADTVSVNGQIDTGLVPTTDGTLDLGSTSNRWGDLFLDGATLHVGDAADDEFTLSYNAGTNLTSLNSDGTAGEMAFLSADTERMRIDENGYLGVGITNPTAPLTVVGGMDVNLSADDNVVIDGSTNQRTITLGVMRFLHTPAVQGTRAISLFLDANNQSDTSGIVVDYDASNFDDGQIGYALKLAVDGTSGTGGEVRGLDVTTLAGSTADVVGLHAGAGVDPVHSFSGAFGNVDTAFIDAGGFTTVTSSFNSTGTDVQMFVANGDVVYVGAGTTFGAISFALATVASGAGIKPTFEFSNGAGWTAFGPNDGTNGMRVNGSISWDAADLSTWATQSVNATTKYWIRITRTQTTLATPPTEDLVQYAATTEYKWDANGDLLIRDIAVNGGDLTTTASTFNLAASATTLALAGGSGSTGCSIDGSGNLACSGSVSGTGGAGGWTDGGTDVTLTTSTDNVGIGGASLAKLSVDGDANEVQFLVQGNSTQSSDLLVAESSAGADYFAVQGDGDVIVDTSTLFVDASNNRVTIGSTTANTGNPFMVSKSDSGTSIDSVNAWASLHNSNTTNNTLSIMTFATNDTGGTLAGGARMAAQFTSHTAGSVSADFIFQNRSAGTWIEPFVIRSTGNVELDGTTFRIDAAGNSVGIGDTTPDYLLDVAGTFGTDGNVTLGDASGDTLTVNGTAVSVPNSLNFDADTLFIDSTSNRIGIGDATPSATLDVLTTNTGAANAMRVDADTITSAAGLQIDADGLTTGVGLRINSDHGSTGTGYRLMHLFDSGTTYNTTTSTGIVLDLQQNLANSAGTLSIDAPTLDMTRSLTAGGGAIINATTAMLSVVNSSGGGAGTLTDTSSVAEFNQANTTNSGEVVHVINQGAGISFRVDDVASDTTPFVIGAAGDVIVGAASFGVSDRLTIVTSNASEGITISQTGASAEAALRFAESTTTNFTLGLHTGSNEFRLSPGTTVNAAANFVMESTGLIGMGTATPDDILHVFGGDSGGSSNGSSRFIVEDDANMFMQFLTPDANENGILFGLAGNSADGGIIYNNASTQNGMVLRTNGNLTRMAIDSTGEIGIGAFSDPAAVLTISSSTDNASGGSGVGGVAWFAVEGDTYTDSATAASGTAASFGFSTFGGPTLAATNATVTTTNAATVYIANDPTPGTNMTITNPWALWIDAGAARFDGNIAVGAVTALPGEELDVEGQIQFDIATTGDTTIGVCKTTTDGTSADTEFVECTSTPGDVAEWYETTGAEAAGDLVMVGSSTLAYAEDLYDPATGLPTGSSANYETATVEKTSVPYAGKLFGIVSTSPLQVMGEAMKDAASNPQPIAISGRVPAKVSDENGAIAAGDPITSSSAAGVGMKATQPGMVVGYALEAYAGPGEGTVMVFVSPGYHLADAIEQGATGDATAGTPGIDSFGLALRGSGWDGAAAQAAAMKLVTDVTDASDYKLSVRNQADTEVAYVSDDGVLSVASDVIVGGKLYPSALGAAQTDAYIYYGGAGDDFMRTNATGWGTGSYDFAEMFPSSQPLEAGEVVAFDTANEFVKRASAEDGMRLAGIVSTRPGFLAGTKEANTYPVALAGRVPTNVSVENGPIAVGDALTVSALRPGYAAKAEEAGMIVGYALEPAAEDGSVIAFVHLGYWPGTGSEPNAGTNNVASTFSGELTTLTMNGNIYMQGNQILNVGAIAGLGGVWSVNAEGAFATEGSYKVVIESYQAEQVETVVPVGLEHKVTLSGTGTLTAGTGAIVFEDVDPRFNDITSTTAPVRVLVTLRGAANGIYVETADRNGFTARETMGGASDVEFDWYVEAYRKDFEPVVEEVPPVEPPAEEPPVEEPPAEVPPTEPPAEEPPVEPPAEEPPPEVPPSEPPPEVPPSEPAP